VLATVAGIDPIGIRVFLRLGDAGERALDLSTSCGEKLTCVARVHQPNSSPAGVTKLAAPRVRLAVERS
jgi:hypothetical protein